jgi:hypothetical protein
MTELANPYRQIPELSPEAVGVLQTLGNMSRNEAWICKGPSRAICQHLAALGLAAYRGCVDEGVDSIYSITDAGRARLNPG